MRDKIRIYSNFDDLQKKCNACLKRDHNNFTCPEIHYVPRKNFIIKRFLYSEPVRERDREKWKKPPCFKNYEFTASEIASFRVISAPKKY